jgi:hypothetical protein
LHTKNDPGAVCPGSFSIFGLAEVQEADGSALGDSTGSMLSRPESLGFSTAGADGLVRAGLDVAAGVLQAPSAPTRASASRIRFSMWISSDRDRPADAGRGGLVVETAD